jgi:protein involved in polysaccharide export with SLBB domain
MNLIATLTIASLRTSLVVISLCGIGIAQSSPLPNGTSSPSSTPGAVNSGSASTLPPSQIINILRERPELVIDLKKVAAERLQSQGVQIQEDSITDEMLFSRIASDPQFDSAVTMWLRARGYITDLDVESQSMQMLDSDDKNSEQQQAIDLTGGIRDNQLSTRGQSLPLGAEDLDAPIAPPPPSRTQSEGALPSLGTNEQTPHAERDPSASPEVVRQPTPYNMLSLRDLYTQMPEQNASLKRFGSAVFLNRGSATSNTVMDLPMGPDYVLGPGDGIEINLWGGVSQRFARTVDREGKVVLPEAGPVVVAGLTLEQAQTMIRDALVPQFRNAHIDLSITKLRTLRVYVVGDVQRPGAYDISSLSTPLNALYAAGGPTAFGSLRTLRHYRGNQLVREIDLYEFLLHGVRSDTDRMQPGDTILVPPVSAQVTVAGMVQRPAIYEIRNEKMLSDVLGMAGGVRVIAALQHITIERVEAHARRVTLSVDLPVGRGPEAVRAALSSFPIQDGDRIVVAPILSHRENTIYVEGHVFRPGRYPYREDMTLSDVIRSYRDLLPEPAEHAEIIRLKPPDYSPETIPFNLSEVLIGDDPIKLQPADTIRIFGRYEIDPPKVSIKGEVLRPGEYPLSHSMTAGDLVKMAGGFKRSALQDQADLASYDVKDGKRVSITHVTLNLGRAADNDASADVPLKPGDVITVHQISGWNDIGASITLHGEVNHPGTYGLLEGEKLSSVIRRAGGFRPTAYPAGAVLERTQVKELEEKSRQELIRQIENVSASARLKPGTAGHEDAAMLQGIVQQQQQVVQRLRTQQATGRLVIKIGSDISRWENTAADIEVRAGDVLTIPKRPTFVLVDGQVYNPSAITYVPGKDAAWYLRQAGGSTQMADRGDIFLIRANGSVLGKGSGEWFKANVLSAKMQPGDVLVVPQKILGGSAVWKNLLGTAQIMSSIAITAHVAGL